MELLEEIIENVLKKKKKKNTFYDEIKSGGIFYEKETFKRKANFDNANDRNV